MLCKDKLPESTGDKLTAWGNGFPLFLGKLDWTLLGKFELYRGSDSSECWIYRRGTIFRPRLSGMLVKNVYMLPGNVESCGRRPNCFKI